MAATNRVTPRDDSWFGWLFGNGMQDTFDTVGSITGSGEFGLNWKSPCRFDKELERTISEKLEARQITSKAALKDTVRLQPKDVDPA